LVSQISHGTDSETFISRTKKTRIFNQFLFFCFKLNYRNGGGNDPPPMIWGPEEMEGKSYQEVLDNVIDWTPEKIRKMQEDHRYGDHEFFCYSVEDGLIPVASNTTKYVEFDEEYVPDDGCLNN